MERRAFLQCLAAGMALPAAAEAVHQRPLFVGQMMDAVGFVRGGVDPVLDDIAARTSANALTTDMVLPSSTRDSAAVRLFSSKIRATKKWTEPPRFVEIAARRSTTL